MTETAYQKRDATRVEFLYIPRGEGSSAALGVDGAHITMTPKEYLVLEAEFLAAMEAPETAPVLAELRALYGNL
ncbi:hypothetical protein K5Y32_22570 [Pantoea sp. DY-15]|uniref:hypothetical protein n=1 Tax=Pantoea sp. DY-15 TaxID=2871489 RepID=UPI001C97893A|nr:hypothetical protein [Pantoea sp. DY-15]MBY4890717.1 hypothetical protein [Pantoea sp. DY-15]